MTSVILVRHGQTEWNRQERFRGRADLALNETGRRQARAVATRLAHSPVSAIYASPLKRAVMTATPLAESLGLRLQTLEGLLDIDYGQWQGLSPAEAVRRDSHLYRLWEYAPHQVHFPGGESLLEVRRRVVATLQKLLARHPDETIVLVSHKVICKILLCAVLGIDNSHFWQVEQDVAAINVFENSEGRFLLTLLNDTCHLRDQGTAS